MLHGFWMTWEQGRGGETETETESESFVLGASAIGRLGRSQQWAPSLSTCLGSRCEHPCASAALGSQHMQTRSSEHLSKMLLFALSRKDYRNIQVKMAGVDALQMAAHSPMSTFIKSMRSAGSTLSESGAASFRIKILWTRPSTRPRGAINR